MTTVAFVDVAAIYTAMVAGKNRMATRAGAIAPAASNRQ